jgi:hypothetical protein
MDQRNPSLEKGQSHLFIGDRKAALHTTALEKNSLHFRNVVSWLVAGTGIKPALIWPKAIANLDEPIQAQCTNFFAFQFFESMLDLPSSLPSALANSAGLPERVPRLRSARVGQLCRRFGPLPMATSGKKKWVHFRWACAKFLRQSFHEWAGHSIAESVWARAYYQQQRERGKDHHAAVRALAFKWIRILFRCWQDRVAYDENKYLAAMANRGSPLNSVLLAATATTVWNCCGF